APPPGSPSITRQYAPARGAPTGATPSRVPAPLASLASPPATEVHPRSSLCPTAASTCAATVQAAPRFMCGRPEPGWRSRSARAAMAPSVHHLSRLREMSRAQLTRVGDGEAVLPLPPPRSRRSSASLSPLCFARGVRGALFWHLISGIWLLTSP